MIDLSSAHKHSERGAALLSVLLLVTVMSVAALAMLETSLGATSKARLVDARAQLSWQIIGAQEAGLIGVETLRNTVGGQITEQTPNFRQSVTTPLPSGLLTTWLDDDSNCFNINALREPEAEDGAEASVFVSYEHLLASLELGEAEIEALRAALVDWLDGDGTQSLSGAEDTYYGRLDPPYRAANVAASTVTEVRSVRGYSQSLFQRLQPLLCARETTDPSILNINTLRPQDAPLLVMAFSGALSLSDAVEILSTRPEAGWIGVEGLLTHELIQEIAPELRRTELLSTRSRFLKIVGQIAYEDEVSAFTTIYALPDIAPARIVRRMYGAS